MGYQFLHVECYARTAGKDKEGNHSIRSILAEAKRELGATSHVAKPKPPKLIYGNLNGVEEAAKEWAESATDTIGRKLRKDGLCLLAGVVSVADDFEDWENYKKRVLIFLRQEYGPRLRAVIEHEDEAHRHIHFFCVPRIGERFDLIHDGKAAILAAKQSGIKLKGDLNSAYRLAMTGLQQRFHTTCSVQFGLTRRGPGRRRLSRGEWVLERENAKAIAEKIKVLESKVDSLERQNSKLEMERNNAQGALREFRVVCGLSVDTVTGTRFGAHETEIAEA